ncbi:MAG: hypothetical protein AAF492_30010, partial [Verrucomicrobiota bacterium]
MIQKTLQSFRQRVARKDGIALVIVLGVLTALIVLTVGFATFLRTERLVAASYVDIVKLRQLGLGALDTLIYKVNNDFSWANEPYPPLNEEYQLPVAGNHGGAGLNDWGGGQAEDVLYGSVQNGGTMFMMPMEVL